MKILKYIAGTFALGLLAPACVDKDPDEQFFPNPDVAFTYEIEGDQYTYDYYVVSTIKFNNTSSASGNFVWDFGDGTTSTEVSPTHKYEKAGLYKVTLTHESKGSTTSPLLIYDIVPVLSVASTSTEIVEYNNTYVTFNLELPNPENLPVRYEWTFPEGTTYEDGTEVTSFTGYSDENGNISYPEKVKFRNIGSQRIDIRTYFDTTGENRRLEDSYLNVQVGTSEPAPTLYYAQRGGNIKAVKLLENIPEGSKVLPYDLGVPAGSTVFNLCYADITTEQVDEEGKPVVEGWIYILDAGKQYYYINDEDGVLGDGKITALRTDGTNVNTVITNVGGAAFLDPFVGTVYNGKLYYTDRNTGCSSIELTKRGEQQGKKSSTERDSYAWQNNLLSMAVVSPTVLSPIALYATKPVIGGGARNTMAKVSCASKTAISTRHRKKQKLPVCQLLWCCRVCVSPHSQSTKTVKASTCGVVLPTQVLYTLNCLQSMPTLIRPKTWWLT